MGQKAFIAVPFNDTKQIFMELAAVIPAVFSQSKKRIKVF